MNIRWDLISAFGFGIFTSYIGYSVLETWEGWVLIIWLVIHGLLPRKKQDRVDIAEYMETRKRKLRNYKF